MSANPHDDFDIRLSRDGVARSIPVSETIFSENWLFFSCLRFRSSESEWAGFGIIWFCNNIESINEIDAHFIQHDEKGSSVSTAVLAFDRANWDSTRELFEEVENSISFFS